MGKETPKSIIEARESGYAAGQRAAWTRLLAQAIEHLGYTGHTAERLIVEREETVVQLRGLCAAIGDNDWPDNLHLGDVIEKHVIWHLDD